MDYNYLYRKLNSRTPLKNDCGKLCGNACCIDTEGDKLGMYLFPGEEEMFYQKKNFSVEDSELTYMGKKAKILFCKPYCNRQERPLACRIFPLFPYITIDGDLKIIVDPRSRAMCPLYRSEAVDLNPAFVRGVTHIGQILCEDEECYEFLFELSRLIDEEVDQIVKSLKKIIN